MSGPERIFRCTRTGRDFLDNEAGDRVWCPYCEAAVVVSPSAWHTETLRAPESGPDVFASLPIAQAITMGRYLRELGPGAVWHRNQCGCCVAVHFPDSPTGWIIGPDGEADHIEADTGRVIP